MLTKKDIRDFQALFNKLFGFAISDEAARIKLSCLVRQMEIIYKPLTRPEYDKYVNENNSYEQIKTPISK